MTIEELEQIAKSVQQENAGYDYEVNVCMDLACASQGAGAPCAGTMNDYRNEALDTLLPNGEVLIAGGYNFHPGTAHNVAAAQSITGGASVPFNVLWTAEVYNPSAGRFVSTVSIAQAHFGAPAH